MGRQRITAIRYHDISAGHRVFGHEGACKNLHGHNYRIHFTISGGLDHLGRVVDFSVIKSGLCAWLDANWDHRFLVWIDDPLAPELQAIDETVVLVTFNPTAEALASFLLNEVGPRLLSGFTELVAVRVEETRKCSATAGLA